LYNHLGWFGEPANQVQVMIENIPTKIQAIRAGQIRAIAVTGSERDPSERWDPCCGEKGGLPAAPAGVGTPSEELPRRWRGPAAKLEVGNAIDEVLLPGGHDA
jgi:hypothetical protein